MTAREVEREKEIARLKSHKATLLMALLTIKSNTKDQTLRDYVEQICARYMEDGDER